MDKQISKSLSDIKVLLEFLRTDGSKKPNHEAQITSLQTLCGMCSEKVVDVLIKVDGLHIIWELCGKTDNPEVCQTCLYALACAVETSDNAKQHLTTKQHFNNIRAILNSDMVPEKTKLCSIYFLLPLLTDNVFGQQLMLSSGCLHILLRTYTQQVKVITNSENPHGNYELWMLSSKALKQAVALPQNKRNQQECARYIPHMITILHESKGEGNIILHSCQVFAAVVANNEYCQETASRARAVEVFILLLQSWICESKKEEIIGNIVTALSTLIGDNAEHRQRFQKLGGVNTLLSLLTSESVCACELGIGHLNQALTILAGCVKDSGKCRQTLCDGNAASAIVRLMNEVDGDEYFGKVTANLLSYCVEKQTVENGSEESTQTGLFDDKTESSLSQVQEEEVTPEKEQSHLGSDDHLHLPSTDAVAAESVTRNELERNDRVMDILERQQEQIDLLQKLLIEERNLRLINNGGKITMPENNLAVVRDKPRLLSKGSSQTAEIRKIMEPMADIKTTERSFCAAEGNRADSNRQDRLTKTFKSSRIQNTITMTQQKHRPIPDASRNKYYDSIYSQPAKENLFADASISNNRNIESQSVMRKPKDKLISSTPLQKGIEKAAVINSTKNKYYIQSKNSIRQHYHRDISAPCDESTLRDRFNAAQSRDRDDIISMCSDILIDEVKKTRMRRRAIRRRNMALTNNGHAMSKERRHVQADWDIYSYYGDDSPRKFKRPIPPHDRRRSRMKFEVDEVKHLQDGVRTLGTNFKDILYGYRFHPRRSAMDLRDKFRNISKTRCDSVAF